MTGHWAWLPERAAESSNGRFLCSGIYGCQTTLKKDGAICLPCRTKMGLTVSAPKKEKAIKEVVCAEELCINILAINSPSPLCMDCRNKAARKLYYSGTEATMKKL